MVELRAHLLASEGLAWTWRRMARTKTLSADIMQTPLKRCLTTLDITLLGIGHMVGAGIYVLVGTVAKDTAGPAIIISFLLAGIVSVLSALCYAEFGARVPKAGSAYIYTYVTIGEFWAFVIGWNIILEHMIAAASVARAWSGYIDSMFGGALSNATSASMIHFHEAFLAPYPDPVAFCVTLVYCALLTIGVKASAYINSILTVVNMFVILFVIVVGGWCTDLDNWRTEGGFAPYGFSGVLAGAATSFYAFVGFDSIATSGEEALTPRRSIPLATVVAMSVVTVAYVLLAAVLTLMVPYYELHPNAALPDAFADNGLVWAKYIISVGALCGMTTTLFGSLFSLPRCVYAMASDGLLFSWLAKVSDKTQVPALNMAVCGFLTAIIALLFDIEKLVQFMSIGTLMAYTIVSASVIILRYRAATSDGLRGGARCDSDDVPPTPLTPAAALPEKDDDDGQEDSTSQEGRLHPPFRRVLLRFLPARFEPQVVSWAVSAFAVAVGLLCSLVQWGGAFLTDSIAAWAVILVVLLAVVILFCVCLIAAHRPASTRHLAFRVPLVPFVPLLSILCNVAFMVHLNPMTWLRFLVWMTLGLILYFGYGMHHSREGELVSSYSTLLSDGPAADTGGNAVLSAVHQKLAQVTSKIISTAANGAVQSKDATQASTDKQPIIDKDSDDDGA